MKVKMISKLWSSANDLTLNEDKTEVIHVSSRFRKSSDIPFVEIANVPIQPVKSERNLGVLLEKILEWMIISKTFVDQLHMLFTRKDALGILWMKNPLKH